MCSIHVFIRRIEMAFDRVVIEGVHCLADSWLVFGKVPGSVGVGTVLTLHQGPLLRLRDVVCSSVRLTTTVF